MGKVTKIVLFFLFLLNVGTFLLFFLAKMQKAQLGDRQVSEEGKRIEGFIKSQMCNDDLTIGVSSALDTLGEEVSLKEYLDLDKRKMMFVCRFMETNCSSCIQYAVSVAHDVAQNIGFDKVVIMVSYRRRRLFNKQKGQLGLMGMAVVYVDELTLPAEGENYPYCFLLDSSLHAHNVFFPDKGFKEITEEYVSLLLKHSNLKN